MAASPIGLPQLGFSLVLKIVGAIAFASLCRFLISGYLVRRNVRETARRYNIPLIPHSWLWGHLHQLAKIVAKSPPGSAGLGISNLLAKEYPEIAKSGVIVLDTWPIIQTQLLVIHPDMQAQFTQEASQPKAEMYPMEFYPFTQCRDLVNLEGQEWKLWRSIFNPGFSSKNLTALLPAFLEEILVMKERIFRHAESGDVFKLENLVQRGTVDVICRAVLGIRLHSQSVDNEPFSRAMQNQISWLVFSYEPVNLVKMLNPYRYFVTWRNNRTMENFLKPHIERGINEYIETEGKIEGPKTINYLAVKSYVSEVQAVDNSKPTTRIDPSFIESVIAHLKIFIFAGHDTTASTLGFAFSKLFSNPHALELARAEHDRVLGADPSDAAARLAADPQLLNQMPYTSAVIRETLRLYPPATTARRGSAGFSLTNPDTGLTFTTQGFMLVVASHASHRMEAFWERPDEFLPERWLAREGEPLHVRRNTFRPFELGPRNCIGQELAQLELRAILAVTLRELDIEPAYPADAPRLFGEQAYQSLVPGEITGHVKDGFPIRVRVRNLKK